MTTLCPKVSCEFDPETPIFHKFHHGMITMNDIVESWNIAFEQKVIPEGTERFILDYRDANFNIGVSQINEISNYYQTQSFFKNARLAVITINPHDVVVPILVQSKDNRFNTRPFSTLKEATKWMLY